MDQGACHYDERELSNATKSRIACWHPQEQNSPVMELFLWDQAVSMAANPLICMHCDDVSLLKVVLRHSQGGGVSASYLLTEPADFLQRQIRLNRAAYLLCRVGCHDQNSSLDHDAMVAGSFCRTYERGAN